MIAKKVVTFGFKHRNPPAGVTVIDVRNVGLKNPHSVYALKNLDGRNPEVSRFVTSTVGYEMIYATLKRQVEHSSTPIICIGCVGGRHRSVTVAEQLAKDLSLEVQHLELV